MKRTVDDVDVRGKRVLVRVDFNVPLDDAGHITDDRRIRAALPTIQKLIDCGGRVILMSHLGRPEPGSNDKSKLSLTPTARRLGEMLGRTVPLVDDCVGTTARAVVSSLGEGDVCVLENLRFHSAETIKDKAAKDDSALRSAKDSFARELAELGDVYVNDAFGTCHRDNASMLTVPQLMEGKPRVVGYLIQKELTFLGGAIVNPTRPFICLLGGAKVSDKLGVIRTLLSKCDAVLIGGAMAYTFDAAAGRAVGKSLIEPDLFDAANELRSIGKERLLIPTDAVLARKIEANAQTEIADGDFPDGWMGLDIGPATIKAYTEKLATAATIVWNGPMGVFEIPPFDVGTLAVANALADATQRGATTIVGGGDSAAAVQQAGLSDRITHISTGGGASLEFLEGKPFVALDVLDDA